MPARKGRQHLIAKTPLRIDPASAARVEGLRAAAQRASDALDARKAILAEPEAPDMVDAAPAVSAVKRKGLWPFGRKVDPVLERKAEIMGQLQAAVAGRPQAGEKAREQESLPRSTREPLRAAG